jgi:hypothetical protein
LEVLPGLDLLDVDGVFIQDISDSFESGVIEHRNSATIHGTARLVVNSAYNWHNQRLRPWITLRDPINDESHTWYLGVYLPETPTRQAGTTPTTYHLSCYDQLQILDTPHGASYSVVTTDTYIDEVETLLDAAGINHSIDQTEAAATIAAAQAWPIDQSTTTLGIINELLAAVGYVGLYMDRTGTARSEPWIDPALRSTVWTYDAAADGTTIEAINTDQDLFEVPNRWVFVNQNDDTPSAGSGLYTVVNQSDGVASTDSRGRTISKIVRVDAADQTALETIGDAVVINDRLPTLRVELTSGPVPLHWHETTLSVTAATVGLTGAALAEESWRFDLLSGRMVHNMRQT